MEIASELKDAAEYAGSDDGVLSDGPVETGPRHEQRRWATVYDAVAGKALHIQVTFANFSC